ncbi:MAG: lipid IV(A) 3-deoxy-D-manno-octulosonic acid transferase [Pseudomonadota bacterium]
MTRNVYTFLLYLLLPLTVLKLLWRARKQPEYLQHWRERYGFYATPLQKPVIWLHCVSVGETRAAEPLVKALLQRYPKHQLLLTHTTPTGRTTSEQLFGNAVQRVYLPYDVPFAVNRFLKHFKPAIGVLMETELWFNLIAGCKQQAIPVLLVNARLSEKSARGYAKLGALAKDGLLGLSAIAAQTEQDAARLQKIGASNVTVAGNLKFDVTPPDSAAELGALLRNMLGKQRPVLLAASTRDGEEALIMDAVAAAQVPDLLTVIVPRHPQRFNEVEALLKKRGVGFVRRSSLAEGVALANDMTYVLGDSMGEMFTYYAACDVAFIGGSLLALGGQNLIEACAMGKPVLIGPHTFNFAQATEQAISAEAALRVQNSADLASAIQTLFTDATKRQHMAAAALSFSESSRGATLRTLILLAAYINE